MKKMKNILALKMFFTGILPRLCLFFFVFSFGLFLYGIESNGITFSVLNFDWSNNILTLQIHPLDSNKYYPKVFEIDTMQSHNIRRNISISISNFKPGIVKPQRKFVDWLYGTSIDDFRRYFNTEVTNLVVDLNRFYYVSNISQFDLCVQYDVYGLANDFIKNSTRSYGKEIFTNRHLSVFSIRK